jgi:arylsulfatase A-like enzyme
MADNRATRRRYLLRIFDEKHVGLTTYALRSPKDMPKILIVLDDAGGLKYNRSHTTELNSPTRPALLTGGNQHCVSMIVAPQSDGSDDDQNDPARAEERFRLSMAPQIPLSS